jgi:hypothetical protein
MLVTGESSPVHGYLRAITFKPQDGIRNAGSNPVVFGSNCRSPRVSDAASAAALIVFAYGGRFTRGARASMTSAIYLAMERCL